MTVHVLLNPCAGGGRAGNSAAEFTAACKAQAFQLCRTEAPGAATLMARELGEAGATVVVAAGGDGTLHEVVNGLMQCPPAQRPALGVVPLGTGNAFARDLGLLPGQWREALAIIAAGHSNPVDVGRVQHGAQSFHFLNVLGAGFVVQAAQAAARCKALGKAAYTLGTLAALMGLRSMPMHIEVDGQLIEEDLLFVEVSNSRYTGTHFLMAPQARLDDGLLDVTLVRALPRRRLLRLFPTIYDGSHLQFDEVTALQGRCVKLLAPAGMPLLVDGEVLGATPAEISVLPACIALLMSRDSGQGA